MKKNNLGLFLNRHIGPSEKEIGYMLKKINWDYGKVILLSLKNGGEL